MYSFVGLALWYVLIAAYDCQIVENHPDIEGEGNSIYLWLWQGYLLPAQAFGNVGTVLPSDFDLWMFGGQLFTAQMIYPRPTINF